MKENNVIFGALAFLDDYKSSPSVSEVAVNTEIRDIYLMNVVVSLGTIKQHNKDTDVVLVTNIDLEEQWRMILKKENIKVYVCPFDEYKMPENVVYSLSYYKLCAFDFMVKNTNYDKLCFVDCDTYCVGSFINIWNEVDSAFLMIPNDAVWSSKIRQEINELHKKIESNSKKSNKMVAHISSGFIAGRRGECECVMELCRNMYEKIRSLMDINPEGGDEIIWSLALEKYSGILYSPRGYVLLSNISATEYVVDKANYEDENIVLWHLPAEKRYALIWAFNVYKKTGHFPKLREMAKACRLRHVKCKYSYTSIRAILYDKNVLKRNVAKFFKLNR